MHTVSICAQVVIALSVAFVWIVRLPNVVKEFHEYGLPDLVRNTVGAAKICLATLLMASVPPVSRDALVHRAPVIIMGGSDGPKPGLGRARRNQEHETLDQQALDLLRQLVKLEEEGLSVG